jgi:antitoxin ParD1/3/4
MKNENITTMNISLTGLLKEHALKRVADRPFTSASDYVRDLIRADMMQLNKLAALQALINEGIQSGEATPLSMAEIIKSAERRLNR